MGGRGSPTAPENRAVRPFGRLRIKNGAPEYCRQGSKRVQKSGILQGQTPYPEQRHVRGVRLYLPNHVYHLRTSTIDHRPLLADAVCQQIILTDLLHYRQALGFKLLGFVIMPDHVHLLVIPGPRADISQIMACLKRHTARAINRHLRRKGSVWRKEFFDHVIRSEEGLRELIDYLHANPVRRRLVDTPEEYVYSSWLAYHSPESVDYVIDTQFQEAGGAVPQPRQKIAPLGPSAGSPATPRRAG